MLMYGFTETFYSIIFSLYNCYVNIIQPSILLLPVDILIEAGPPFPFNVQSGFFLALARRFFL